MAKYRKKPVVVDAIKLTSESVPDVLEFISGEHFSLMMVNQVLIDQELTIRTLEGIMTASFGDYIIKGVQGEFYPCKPDIFEQTYNKAE